MSTERVHRHRRSWSGLAVLAAVTTTCAAGASVTNNWINWNAPGSYSQNAQYAPWAGQAANNNGNYTYSSTASGTIAMPDTSTVNVSFSGEVVNPNSFGWPTVGSVYGLPTGFASVAGTTTSDFWSTRPATNASTYTSANATAPTNGDHIGLVGSSATTQTITFSAPVTNIVMAIYSLGTSSVTASWDFNQNFDILSDNDGASLHGSTGSGLTRTATGGIHRLSGNEGSGMIQFFGTFTSLTWTVSAPEVWASWNIGVTSAAAPSAVPGTGLAAIGTLGLAGLARRRRR